MELTKIRKASKKQVEARILKKTGGNLYDILPIVKTEHKFSKKTEETALSIKSLFEQLNSAVDLSIGMNIDRYSRHSDTRADTKRLVEKVLSVIKTKVNDVVFSEDVSFPSQIVNPSAEENRLFEKLGISRRSSYGNTALEDVYENGEHLSSRGIQAITHLSKMKTADLIDVVDKMQLVLIPGDFLKDESLKCSSNVRLTTDALSNFKRMFTGTFGERYNYYVACPISHYSFYNHLDSEKCSLPVYTRNFMSEFTTISLQIPAIRGMKTQIDSLKERFDIMESDQQHIKQSIDTLSSQVKRLDQISKANQQQIVMQSNAIQSLMSANDGLESRVRVLEHICATDPVAVAIPKKNIDSNFTDLNGECIIGPCWGPDFELFAIVATKLNFFLNQREYLNMISNNVLGY